MVHLPESASSRSAPIRSRRAAVGKRAKIPNESEHAGVECLLVKKARRHASVTLDTAESSTEDHHANMPASMCRFASASARAASTGAENVDSSSESFDSEPIYCGCALDASSPII
ncbi:hypothetical protein JG687_00013329 [Phytophthora cactorum]|uniref:Uncharacterized protein n=1 Tax=Phytophthora cactorum TaxID=29920 RepID=A0A329SAW4_9STRA|nr:hypothetical protein Pcac1_g17359 [Phytophthora cactorum]KAG2792316.1 hypothetical protein PC111_g23520 [Phytophthora cactorum]KAG2792755.1 hypothetical protein PC112_g23731 [Phytophthora cactorum]KAG2843453.1 hypothetical protein PC113_g18593 [Phytophthora cactorum]KAG2872269.1 hypothetical protein PC114_g26474 [Phytophthora cactorum]